MRGSPGRRRVPRYPVAVPVDITVLRSGVPDNIPGRSLNVGEGGLAVILAGELSPGDPVGVEFRLPQLAVPLHAKAVVRHQARLRCGLEFLGLSLEQRELIRRWERGAAETRAAAKPAADSPAARLANAVASRGAVPARRSKFWRVLGLIAALVTLAGFLAWWHWQQAWTELEQQISAQATLTGQPYVSVPADVMEQLLTHKVEPIYPEAARRANIQGIVALKLVIGRDGAVIDLRRLSGPDELVSAAVDAVKWWHFQPYRVNGEPVEVETTVNVEFRTGP
jgi:TonB family protein